MRKNKQDIAALRQEVKAQRERLIDEKVEKGEAVRAYVVASISPSRDDLPTHHGDREIVYDDVIVTGVPRREGPVVWLIEKGGKNPVPLEGWLEPSRQPAEFDHYKAFAEVEAS